jgi:Predicted transcriptional regulators
MELNYYEIGQHIRKYRKAYNLSQEQLAEKVSISTTHMSHIETGSTKLSLPVFAKIASALSVHTDSLLHDSPTINRTDLGNELLNLLDSCSTEDAHILLDTMKTLKTSLTKYHK